MRPRLNIRVFEARLAGALRVRPVILLGEGLAAADDDAELLEELSRADSTSRQWRSEKSGSVHAVQLRSLGPTHDRQYG